MTEAEDDAERVRAWFIAMSIRGRVRAAEAAPDDPKAAPWRILRDSTLSLREIAGLYHHLPVPRARRPGRPKLRQRLDEELLGPMAEGIAATPGAKLTTVARTLLKSKGVENGLKNRADNLVRKYNRVTKSG